MINIDLLLKNIEFKNSLKKYGILLASIMFIWSGQNKIFNFDKKVLTLVKKTNLNTNICMFGMVLVIILEIIGFLFLIEYYFKKSYYFKKLYLYNLFDKLNIFIKISQKQLIQIILLLLLLFIIVVTIIYHPPNMEHPIPFLSNLTTFGLFLYVYSDL